MSKTIAVIGMPEQGKSKFITEYLKANTQRSALAYDVNGYEYGEKWGVNLSLDTRQKRCRYIGRDLPSKERYQEFINLVKGRRNCDIVFEEATGYLSGKLSDVIVGMLIDRRHTGNNYFLVFHSVKSMPPSLLLHLDIIYLFKTMDDLEDIKAKDKRLIEPFAQMAMKPFGSKGLLINWSGKKLENA